MAAGEEAKSCRAGVDLERAEGADADAVERLPLRLRALEVVLDLAERRGRVTRGDPTVFENPSSLSADRTDESVHLAVGLRPGPTTSGLGNRGRRNNP